MEATVREYTVKKKVLMLEIPYSEAEVIASNGSLTKEVSTSIVELIRDTLENERLIEFANNSEDVPF